MSTDPKGSTEVDLEANRSIDRPNMSESHMSSAASVANMKEELILDRSDERGLSQTLIGANAVSTRQGIVGKHKRTPVHLGWTDVQLTAKTRSGNIIQGYSAGEKFLLRGVSGYCKSGTLMAIMGSSGAGKTSLLNVLSARTNSAGLVYSGSVTLNGRPASKLLKKYTAFCEQEDLFFRFMTVHEHLRFQATLRMENVSAQDRERRIEEVMNELTLTRIKDNLIGNLGKGGISGGERRRLSFANEILTDPSLLFLDEPTSGLDSYMAENIVTGLKELAAAGRTVVATIHSPSSYVYSMFDAVMFLADGKAAYFGTTQNAPGYFQSVGYPVTEFTNPADHFIRMLSVLPEPHKDASLARINTLLVAWESKKSEADAVVAGLIEEARAQPEDLAPKRLSRYKVPYFSQFAPLVQRSLRNVLRDPLLTRANVMKTLIVGLIVGLIYLTQPNNQKSIQNKNGAVFFILINQSMGGVFGVVNAFPIELPVFLREHKAGMYRPSVYYFALTFADIIFQVAFPFAFVTIAYWLVYFDPDFSRYLAFALVVVLTTNCATSLGYMIGTMMSSLGAALAVAPLMLLPFIIFGGFFLNNATVPAYFSWLSAISFFRYGFEALCIIIWKDKPIGCDSEEDCTFSNGNQVLRTLAFDSENLVFDIIMLVVLLVAFRIISFFFLWMRARNNVRNLTL